MVKRFSTVRDTQRGSHVTQSYMEKRRGRREIEVTRRKREGIKRSENKLTSNHFPMLKKDSDAGRDCGQEEKEMTEDEMAGWHHPIVSVGTLLSHQHFTHPMTTVRPMTTVSIQAFA